MIWTVPNALTFARLLAAPGVAVPFMLLPRPEADIWALGIFLAAAATDFLDGWLARRLGQESALGRVLDPIADKAMVVIALALLLALHGVWGGAGSPTSPPDGPPDRPVPLSWVVTLPVVTILMREILVSGLREALGPGAQLAVTRLAKRKTAAQMAAIPAVLLWEPLRAGSPDGATTPARLAWVSGFGLLLLWIAAIFTVITGWDYARKALRYIREEEDRA